MWPGAQVPWVSLGLGPLCRRRVWPCAALRLAPSLQPCLHTFCAACYSGWMERSSLCPTCRCPVERICKNHILNNLVEAYLLQHPGKWAAACPLGLPPVPRSCHMFPRGCYLSPGPAACPPELLPVPWSLPRVPRARHMSPGPATCPPGPLPVPHACHLSLSPSLAACPLGHLPAELCAFLPDKSRSEDDVRSMAARNKITQDMLQPRVRRSFSDEEGSSEDLLALSDVDSESSDVR